MAQGVTVQFRGPVFSGASKSIIDRSISRGLRRAAPVMIGAIKQETPVGATGHARQSIAAVHERRAVNIVSHPPAAAYYQKIEEGREPGPIGNPQSLRLWVKRVVKPTVKEFDTVYYLIARKIAREGTRAQRPVRIARGKKEQRFLKVFTHEATRTLAKLNG